MEQTPEKMMTRRPQVMPLEKRLMLDASLPVLAGQVLWLDAADATTIRDADGDNAATGTGGSNNGFGGTIATWVDKSGSGFNLTSTVAGERPIYTNTLNGHNVVTFDGTNDRMFNASAVIGGDDVTIFMVFNRTTNSGRDALFELGGTGSRNAMFIGNTANKISYYLNTTFYNYTPNYTGSSYQMLSLMQDGTAISGYLNGVSTLSGTGTARASTTGIYLADDSTSGDQLQGHIAEFIVYDRDLSADERHDVENYLATKWGFTITNANPVSATNTGATVSQGDFTTIASANLAYTDADNSESILRYTITDLTDYGTLTNTNTSHTYILGESFTQADIDAGYIRYTHNNSTNFADSFSFTVSDGYGTSAADTYNITVTPDNLAPVIQGWTLVSSENFEGGATGWSDNTTTVGSSYFTEFLGRFSQDGGIQNIYKTYTLSGTQDYAILTFDFYRIDDWEAAENFQIFIDDVLVFDTAFNVTTYVQPADGAVGPVSYTVQELMPFNTNIGFSTSQDQMLRFTMTVNTGAAAVKLGFSSTLDEAASNESWGIDNVHVYEVADGGTPGPFHVVENEANGRVIGSITASDPDVIDTITYSITGGTGVGVFAIDANTGAITVANSSALNYESTTSFTLVVRATDNGVPAMYDEATITINVIDEQENTAPTVPAIPTQTIAEDVAIGTVIATMTATDAEGDNITWAITGGNTDNIFAIDSVTGVITVINAPNYEYDSSYSLTVRAQDDGFGNLTRNRTVVVNITDVNEAPTFNIPQTFLDLNPYLRYDSTTGNFYRYVSTTATYATAAANATGMMLNGVAGHLATAGTAAESTFIRSLGAASIWLAGSDSVTEGTWIWDYGPDAGTSFWLGNSGGSAQNGYFTNWAAAQPSTGAATNDYVEMRANGLWYAISGASARAYVVEWEGADVMAALGNGPYALNENPVLGQSVGFVHAGDPDAGDTMTFSVTGGTGSSYFTVNTSTGEITVTDPAALSYELGTSYTLDLRVEDTGGLFDTITVTININDVNEMPVVGTNTGVTLDEGGSITITNAMLSSSDDDALPLDSALVYTVTNVTDNGQLYNTNTSLALGLGATFTQGDINNGYITYTHDGGETIADAFSFTVGDGVNTTAAANFNITVNPVNDAPVFDSWTLVSFEDFQAGATGWSDNTTETSNPYLTRFLGRHSQEGGAQNTHKTYALSGDQDHVVISFDVYKIDSWDGEFFRVFINDSQAINLSFTQGSFQMPPDGTNGIVSWTVQERTPFAANFAFGTWNEQIFRFILTIDTQGTDVKLGFSSTLDQAITDESWGVDNISIYEVGDTGGGGRYDIVENMANGTVVGTVTARDAENDTLSYSITGGTGAGVFAINASTGVITVTNSAMLDYETTTSFTLDVQVTDNGSPNMSATRTITINVIDMPENTAPTINALGPLNVAENAANNTVLGTMTGSDAESNTITWTITAGNTDNIFAINSATGVIRVSSNANLNREYNNQYTLTIRAQDNGFGTLASTQNVVINITNINEAPTFNIPQSFLNENPYLRYNATTGNFYQYVSSVVNYATASANASAALLNGVAGHLAVINSAAENTYVRGLGALSIWLGGSDAVTEGTWIWQGGPDNGMNFWLGTAGGSAQNGYYTNWLAGQPDAGTVNEDYLEMQTSGAWSDIAGTNTRAYVIEWEGAAVLAALGNGPYAINENPTMGQSVGYVHARDADVGDVLTYSITGGTGSSYFTIDGSTGQITVTDPAALSYELGASYTLNVRVQDVGGLFSTQTVTININDINEVPVVTANTGVTLNEGATVVITNAMLSSYDDDALPLDTALLYRVTNDVDNGRLYNSNTSSYLQQNSTFTQGDINNGYIRYIHNGGETTADAFSFTVSDGVNTTAAANFNITVNAVNDAPTFDQVQAVLYGNPSLVYNPATGNFYQYIETTATYAAAEANAASMLVNGVAGYVTQINSAAENNFVRALLAGSNSWIGGSDAAVEGEWRYIAGPNNGLLFWLGTATGSAQNGQYTNWNGGEPNNSGNEDAIELRPNGGWNDINATTPHVYVVEWEGADVIAAGIQNGPYTIAENSALGTSVGFAMARDPDIGDSISYSITGGTGAGIFVINSATGEITLNASISYEVASSYTLDLRAQDTGGLFATRTVTINISDINEAPVVTANTGVTLNEGAAATITSAMLSSYDDDFLPLDTALVYRVTDDVDNGRLYNSNTGRYLMQNSTFTQGDINNGYIQYIHNDGETTADAFSFTVSDGVITIPASTFNITVTPVNDAPTFDQIQAVLYGNPSLVYNAVTGNFYQYVETATNYMTAESIAASMLVNGVSGYVVQINSAAENNFIRGLIAAPSWVGGTDSAVEGEWRYAAGPNAGLLFWMGGSGGSAQNGQYTNWNGGEPNNSGGNEDGIEMQVGGGWNDTNVNGTRTYVVEWEGAAVIAAGFQNGPYTIAENSALGTSLGIATARDPDPGDTIAYSITGGTGAGVFSINSATGEITLSAPVNYEVVNFYTLDLRVQDTNGLFDTITVSVNITNVNDAPDSISLTHNRITENSPLATVIGDFSGTDEDVGDVLTFSLISNPGGKFVLVGNQLRTAGDIDYELNQNFFITVRADDGNGGTLDRTFQIMVDDVLDTFTPPPSTGDLPNGPSFAADRDDDDVQFISILRASMDGGGDFDSFYGRQILREEVTFAIRDMLGTYGDATPNLEEEVLGFGMNMLYGGTIPLAPEEMMDVGTGFTNIREALEFLQKMADSQREGLQETQENPDAARAEQIPSNTHDRRFVDVMTYHEERAARLREALLQSGAGQSPQQQQDSA